MMSDARREALVQRVRHAFDPKRLMNPGKVLPGPKVCAEAILRKEAADVVR